MVTRKVAAAFAAGCPSVIKPAAETPLTALALAELAARAGFPEGSINIITTLRHTVEVGKILTQHPGVSKFSFTGSTRVGKLLAAQCTTTMKKTSMELGGNAPFIVFDDADIKEAVAGLMASKFRLSGQTCICASRVFVQRGIHAKFVEAVVKEVAQFRLGPGKDAQTTHGPLISPQAARKVESHVDDAISKGASLKLGGKVAEQLGPAFFEPTVLSGVSMDALCASEETFGPVLPIFEFETESDVISMANQTEVGLAGYFFTKDTSRVWRVSEAIDVGMVSLTPL